MIVAQPPAEDVETDVCVVGSGPAGLTLAQGLAGSGLRVCVLESGGADPDDRRTSLTEAESVGYSYYRLATARIRAFGGTSRHWPLEEGWRARPLEPLDFEARPGVPHTGWPITGTELEPYYARAQRICGLGPYSYDAEDWEDDGARCLPLPPARAQTAMFHLGTTDFDRYRDAVARASDVRLLLNAHVLQIATDETAQRVSHVRVASHHGRRFDVRAKAYVLAAGGLENARLLLLGNRRHPDGLGNEHDNVGRYFMERLSARAGWLRPREPGIAARARLYDVRQVGTALVQGTLTLAPEVLEREQLLNCTFFLLPRSRPFASEATRSLATLRLGLQRQPRPEGMLRHVRNVVTNLDELAAAAYRQVVPSADGDILIFRAQAEQSPNPSSRVTLGAERDVFGLSRLRLDWRLSDFDRYSIRRTQELLDEELQAAGIGSIERKFGDEDPPALFEGNYHHMGTTRMHVDPRKGVVDADCRMHAVDNLYVAGSSVFPTAGFANPTLTVVALAARLADHLRTRLRADRSPRGASDAAGEGST